MADLDDQEQEIAITLKVQRKLFVVMAPPPATVTQRTVMQHFGIPPRAYLDMVRDGRIAVKKLGKLRVATYEDVRRVLTEGAELRARIQRAAKPAPERTPIPDPNLIPDAIRYIQDAGTKKEAKRRSKEISDRAFELCRRYDATLEDNVPNPEANPALYNQALELLIASCSAWSDPGEQAAPGSKCCWCSRPAYAIEQRQEDRGPWPPS